MPTDKKTVDWYNKHAEEYRDHLRVEKAPFHFQLEKPAIRKLIPNIKGKSVISLGCGSGDDTNYLKQKGAKRAVGVDISKRLIAIAKVSFPDCEFFLMDIEKLQFRPAEFDFAYSSLALHYIDKWDKVLQSAYKILKPGSKFVFSTGHTFFEAMERDQERLYRLFGYQTDQKTEKRIIYGNYFKPKPISGAYGMDIVTYYQPFETIIKEILNAGFTITNFVEPKPLKSMKQNEPGSYRTYSRMPIFMIFELLKPK